MRNKGIWILIMLAIIVGVAFWSVGGSRVKDEAPYYLKNIIGETATVTIKDKAFKVEVAKTPKARAKGLSGREYLAPDKGMLFVFPEPGVYPFTMQDTLIVLDIVWILDDKIVFIARKAQPEQETINPEVNANYVLEVGGGNAAGLQVYDQVGITF
jgi:uncharacterized membrane protein (UPF0127 family)